jgi:hypothetical protein
MQIVCLVTKKKSHQSLLRLQLLCIAEHSREKCDGHSNKFPVLVILVVHKYCPIRKDDDRRNLRHEYEHTSLIIPNSDHSRFVDQGAFYVDNGITRSNLAQGTDVPTSAYFCSLVLTICNWRPHCGWNPCA